MVEIQEKEAIATIDSKPSILVGIPAFNEEKTVARVVLEAQKYSDRVVVCDDGSTDMTAEIAERLGATVIKHRENLGYGAAVQSIFKYARETNAEILVTLDADGQHDPSEISAVVKPIVKGAADVVIGSRFVDGKLARTMPWYRRAGVKFITKLANGSSRQNGVRDGQSGFRAYNRLSIRNLVVSENGMGVSAEILINARKQGLTICEVSSSCIYSNGARTSTHHPLSQGLGVVGSIVRLFVEEKPLTLLGIPGLVSLAAGVFFGAWLLNIYSSAHQIETNVALASIAFLMIGFFCLSTAITLYAISRIAARSNHR